MLVKWRWRLLMVFNPDEVEKDFSEEEIFELMKGGIEK